MHVLHSNPALRQPGKRTLREDLSTPDAPHGAAVGLSLRAGRVGASDQTSQLNLSLTDVNMSVPQRQSVWGKTSTKTLKFDGTSALYFRNCPRHRRVFPLGCGGSVRWGRRVELIITHY